MTYADYVPCKNTFSASMHIPITAFGQTMCGNMLELLIIFKVSQLDFFLSQEWDAGGVIQIVKNCYNQPGLHGPKSTNSKHNIFS